MAVTPAVILLQRSGVAHQLMSYDHDPTSDAFGIEAAEALGLDPSVVYKTLVVSADGGPSGRSHAVAVVAVDARLELKAVAAAAGAKKAAMADRAEAERLTGYIRGGISPLAQKRRLATFVDSSAEDLTTMYVSGGRRGLDIGLAPADLLALTNGRFAPIARR